MPRPRLKYAKEARQLYYVSRTVLHMSRRKRAEDYHYIDAEAITGIWRRSQGRPLAIVGWVCEDLGKPKLNALITAKARNNMPGPGFFCAPDWFREPITNAEYPAYIERVLAEQDYPDLPLSVFVAADEAQQQHFAEYHAETENDDE